VRGPNTARFKTLSVPLSHPGTCGHPGLVRRPLAKTYKHQSWTKRKCLRTGWEGLNETVRGVMTHQMTVTRSSNRAQFETFSTPLSQAQTFNPLMLTHETKTAPLILNRIPPNMILSWKSAKRKQNTRLICNAYHLALEPVVYLQNRVRNLDLGAVLDWKRRGMLSRLPMFSADREPGSIDRRLGIYTIIHQPFGAVIHNPALRS
jgi:hypothetical protein